MKMIFNYDANKTHFHNKGFALSLVLRVRFFGIRKWPIVHVTEFLETKTECSTKPKLFHCHVFALARGGNNSTCLVLYTLRYFQVLYP